MANKTLYPFGTNGTLPSSVGIIDDLTTGGHDKALSAAAGKTLNERFKSLSSVTLPSELSSFIKLPDNTWTSGGTTKCVLIPVSAGDMYRITANDIYLCYYAVLKNNTTTAQTAPTYATGWTSPDDIDTETSVDVVIPSDGAYLYISTHSVSYDTTPVVEKIEFKSVIETIEGNIVNNLNTDANNKSLSASMGKTLNDKFEGFGDVTLPSELNYIITDQNKWYSIGNVRCVLIPVEEDEVYRITANDIYECAFAVLKNDTPVTDSTPTYATGWTQKRVLSTDTSEQLTIPSDGVYLYVQTHTINYDTTPVVEKMVVGGLDDKISSKIVNNLTDGGVDKMLSAEQGKILNERMSYWGVELPTSVRAIISDQNKWVLNNGNTKCCLLSVQSGEKYRITANSTYETRYAVLQDDTPTSNASPIYATGYSAPISVATDATAYVTIPSDGVLLYIWTHSVNYDTTPTVEKISNDSVAQNVDVLIKQYAAENNHFPTELILGEETNIFYTIDDFLMAHDYDPDNNIDNIKFSNDLGKTWITKPNVWGIIINVFMFTDGTLFFVGKKPEGCFCYWTRDFDTFTQIYAIDYDGSNYVTTAGETRFGLILPISKHTYVHGTEYYLFGDYVITSGKPHIWYALSDENGVTVRSAFAFGYEQIDGNTIYARHFHGFLYNPYNDYFYALTGDSATQCHIMRGRHDSNHVWTWEIVATGPEYKIGSVVFDEGNMFFSTDYTDSSLYDKRGLLSVPINDIRVERFRYWFRATQSFMAEGSYRGNAAISGFCNDPHGWRIMGTDQDGNSKLLIAKGDHNYVWVDNDKGRKLWFWIGPNNKGDVYVPWYTPGFSVSGEDWIKLSHRKLYNFTEIMRNSGAVDFFDGWKGTTR